MRLLILCAMLLVTPAAGLAAAWCSLDSSTLHFESAFEGETLPGAFRDFRVVLRFDPEAPAKGSLHVVVMLASADMGDSEMNGILADPVWFDAGRFGKAVFKSQSIASREAGGYVAEGLLSLKGRERAVRVPFSWRSTGDEAAMRGEFRLRRTDFDVGSGEWADDDAIGVDVRVQFDVRLAHCD